MPQFQFNYKEYTTEIDLNKQWLELIQVARHATQHAYAPYSKFHVGAAILIESNKIITGFNIENASYPIGICAERTALSSTLAQYPTQKIIAIAISYISPTQKNNTPAFPCGMCRQFMLEIEEKNESPIPVILAGQTGNIIVIERCKDLLPFSFSSADL